MATTSNMADELEHSDLSADESEEEDGEYAPGVR